MRKHNLPRLPDGRASGCALPRLRWAGAGYLAKQRNSQALVAQFSSSGHLLDYGAVRTRFSFSVVERKPWRANRGDRSALVRAVLFVAAKL